MIAILGAGVAGSSLAWALTERGFSDVHVFDVHPFGHGSTTRATGGFRTQFASMLNIELSVASRPFFVKYAHDISFRSTGYAFVACSATDLRRLDEWRDFQCGFGLPILHKPAGTVFPWMALPAEAASNVCGLDGTFDPQQMLRLLHHMAGANGASFHLNADVPESLDFTTMVVAAGYWSAEAARPFGIEVPITRELRKVWRLGGTGCPAAMPLGVDLEGGWVFRERDGDLLLVSPKSELEPDPLLRDWVSRRLGHGNVPSVRETWDGFYEVTPDSHPLVGPSSDPRVWLSCGFSGHGLMHAPTVAMSLAAMLLGETPPMDISSLAPNRKEMLHEPTHI